MNFYYIKKMNYQLNNVMGNESSQGFNDSNKQEYERLLLSQRDQLDSLKQENINLKLKLFEQENKHEDELQKQHLQNQKNNL